MRGRANRQVADHPGALFGSSMAEKAQAWSGIAASSSDDIGPDQWSASRVASSRRVPWL